MKGRTLEAGRWQNTLIKQRKLPQSEYLLPIIISKSTSPREWYQNSIESEQISACTFHAIHPLSDFGVSFPFSADVSFSSHIWINNYHSGFSFSLLCFFPFTFPFLPIHLPFAHSLLSLTMYQIFFFNFKFSVQRSFYSFWDPKKPLTIYKRGVLLTKF